MEERVNSLKLGGPEDKICNSKEKTLEEIYKIFKQSQDQNHQQSRQGTVGYYPSSPCPSCGRCPTCGRGGWNQPYVTYTLCGTTYSPTGTYTN